MNQSNTAVLQILKEINSEAFSEKYILLLTRLEILTNSVIDNADDEDLTDLVATGFWQLSLIDEVRQLLYSYDDELQKLCGIMAKGHGIEENTGLSLV